MKIINCGNGLHEREVKGIETLASLPPHWFAYTNLDLATAPGSSREIDVIIVADDRILVVDLKHWNGPIESRDGHWFNAGKDHGPSPVGKIGANARNIYIQLEAHLKRYAKGSKVVVPKVQGLVVLTKNADFSGVAETEERAVMPVAAFTSALKSVPKRIETFGKAPPAGLLTSPEWKDQLAKFFNVSKGVFVPGRRTYGGYYATSTAPSFEHPQGIYAEFEASDERESPTLGVLRLWDFTKAETRFQTEKGRGEIAGREQEVIAYLQDRCDHCDNVIIDGKTRDPNFGVRYWEVFERRRRLQRLADFAGTELSELSRSDRFELARQLLVSIDALHLAEAAHLDLGQHSVWVQRPSTVRISHLMAASYPDVRSLGESRFQFLSTGKLPEDLFGVETTPKRRDVFLAASVIHRLLLGVAPKAASGFPEWSSSADATGEYLELHGWFESALALEPMQRFKDAGAALTAFNAAVSVRPTPAEVIEGLERHRGAIKSQMALFQAYPPSEVLCDDETRALWRAAKDGRDLLVKVWKRAAWGDQTKEGPRILDFLDQVAELAALEPEGCAKVVGTMWLGDAIVMVQEWIDLPNVERVIAEQQAAFDESSRLQFIAAIAGRVEGLHALRLAHGDLKPANILLNVVEPGEPVIVDLIDFTALNDGDTATSRYSPESGGRYERDCFAVTEIAKELLEGSTSKPASRVREAIVKVRNDEPANASLLPLIDALNSHDVASEESQVLRLTSQYVEAGPLLSDEGRYFLRKAQWNRALIIRGACEELEIRVDAGGKPFRLDRRRIEQSRIKSNQRFEFGYIDTPIIVVDGPTTGLSAILPILERGDVVAALGEANAKAIEAQAADTVQELEEERDIIQGEPPEDDLIEAIAAEGPPTGQIDVARLWETLVDEERELVTYGQVTSASVFDRGVNRHKVHFDLLSGSFDYNRRDRVMVNGKIETATGVPLVNLTCNARKLTHCIWKACVTIRVMDLHLSKKEMNFVSGAEWRNRASIGGKRRSNG